MADQARVRAVLEHRRGPRLAPAGDHPPQVHVAPVEGPLGRVLVVRPAIGVPELHRRVDVEHATVVAPLHDFAAIDVPRQIDEQVAGREVLAQQAAQVLRRHAILDEGYALLDPGLQSRGSFGSKSMIVMRFGSTLMCFSRMGSVQRATAPKPTNKMRFGDKNIRYPRRLINRVNRSAAQKNEAGPIRALRFAEQGTAPVRLADSTGVDM